jgi:hypothetical protein
MFVLEEYINIIILIYVHIKIPMSAFVQYNRFGPCISFGQEAITKPETVIEIEIPNLPGGLLYDILYCISVKQFNHPQLN